MYIYLYHYQLIKSTTAPFAYPSLMPKYEHVLLCILGIVTVLYVCESQSLVALTPNSINQSNPQITMYNATATPPQNSSFNYELKISNCSFSLYVYNQTLTQFQENTPYTVIIQGLNIQQTINRSVSVSIGTLYGNINPIFNDGTNSTLCTSSFCILTITNNCPTNLNQYNYFDVARINISTLSVILSYDVLCNNQFQQTTLEYGLIVQIVFCSILITVVAVYSHAWSINGRGIRIGLPFVLAFNGLLILGGILIAFNETDVVKVTMNVLSWIVGIASVWLCSNQTLFLLRKVRCLKKELLQFTYFSVRIMDLASLCVALIVCFLWWIFHKNWIINDIISTCIIIAAIKVLKFTNFKDALLCFCITMGVEMVFVLISIYALPTSYNVLILNNFNYPFQFQIPTLNPVFQQLCAWLPVTALIYPGVLMSYMRRFDTCRSTHVYIITCVVIFVAGSFVSIFMSVGTRNQWPFGLVSEPTTLFFVSLFAWRRRELKTLWKGEFYDQQFANKDSLKTLEQMISKEKVRHSDAYTPELFQGLRPNWRVTQLTQLKIRANSNIKRQQKIKNEEFNETQKKKQATQVLNNIAHMNQDRKSINTVKSNNTVNSIPFFRIIEQTNKQKQNSKYELNQKIQNKQQRYQNSQI